MKQWRIIQASLSHQVEEDYVLGSVAEGTVQNNAAERRSDDQQCGIQVRQLNNSCYETSPTLSEQCAITSMSQPSMMQSYNNTFVLAEQSNTVMEGLDFFATQEQFQYTLPGAELSRTDRLQKLAEMLSDERLELLLEIFGTCSQEQQSLPFCFHREL